MMPRISCQVRIPVILRLPASVYVQYIYGCSAVHGNQVFSLLFAIQFSSQNELLTNGRKCFMSLHGKTPNAYDNNLC